MNPGIDGEVINYKYWQTLRSVKTDQRETKPSQDAIEFERHLQKLESENRLYEMGLAMKQASQQTNKDVVCSIEALRQQERSKTKKRPDIDSQWYLTRDKLVDDADDHIVDNLVARVEHNPEYVPIVQKIEPQEPRSSTDL